MCEHGILYVSYHFGSAKEIMNYGQQGFYDRIELNRIPTHMEMAKLIQGPCNSPLNVQLILMPMYPLCALKLHDMCMYPSCVDVVNVVTKLCASCQ